MLRDTASAKLVMRAGNAVADLFISLNIVYVYIESDSPLWATRSHLPSNFLCVALPTK